MMENARKTIMELLKYVEGFEVLKQIEKWEIEPFPVGGLDLMEAGVLKGPTMQFVLNHLFDLWKQVKSFWVVNSIFTFLRR